MSEVPKTLILIIRKFNKKKLSFIPIFNGHVVFKQKITSSLPSSMALLKAHPLCKHSLDTTQVEIDPVLPRFHLFLPGWRQSERIEFSWRLLRLRKQSQPTNWYLASSNLPQISPLQSSLETHRLLFLALYGLRPRWHRSSCFLYISLYSYSTMPPTACSAEFLVSLTIGDNAHRQSWRCWVVFCNSKPSWL